MKLDRFSPQKLSPWLPLAYAIHLIDERFTRNGVAEWATRVAGMPFTNEEWFAVNTISLLLIAIISWGIRKNRLASFSLLILSGHVLMHATQHLLGAIRFGEFSPGIWTGVVFCLPVAVLAAISGFRRLPTARAIAGITFGFATFQPIWHAVFLYISTGPGHAA